jgi:hypothetical protein
MMFRTVRITTCALLIVICTCTALAQVHVAEPPVNLGDTSFLDALGGPGGMIEEIGDGYHSGQVMDSSGKPIAGAPAANVTSGLTHVAYLANQRMIGAWYGVEVVASLAHVNAGGTARGWGDTTVAPFILQWPERKLVNMRIQHRFAMDFGLPTGEYNRSSPANVGSNAWSVHPYYAITVYPAKGWETSWRIHYLWNATNHAPPRTSGAQSTQAGQAIHFNATLARALGRRLWLGANGYYLKQVTAPQLNGAAIANSPEQVGAIGPGAVWNRGNVFLYANAYHEFGSENRTRGDRLVFRAQWILKPQKPSSRLR